MFERVLINKRVKDFLVPHHLWAARFYLLPKIHKPGNPGRPIEASNGAPTENFSLFTDFYLRPSIIQLTLEEKSFQINFISSRDGAEKSTETRRGWKSLKNRTPLRNDAGPLSGLQRNALASLVHFVTYSTKRTRDASALHWRPNRGLHRSVVGKGSRRLFTPVLFLYFFQLHSYLKWSFFRKFFPPSCYSFWGGGGGFLNQFSKPTSLHLRIRYLTADERVDR